MNKLSVMGGGLIATLGGVLLAFAASNLMHPSSHPITTGWYARDDSNAIGSDITDWNMSKGETGVRCLCGDGFKGYDIKDDFVVTVAPEGYSDTIGRRFKRVEVGCGNCAD